MRKAFPIVYIITILLLGMVHILYEPAESYNEIIKLALSWPVMVFIILSWLVLLFRDNISYVLSSFRAMDIKGVKISMQSELDEQPDNERISPQAMVKIIEERDLQWKKYVDDQEAISNDIKDRAKQDIDYFYRQDLRWRFRYADMQILMIALKTS